MFNRVSPETVMLPAPKSYSEDVDIIKLPPPKACPEKEERVYVNDQAQLLQLMTATLSNGCLLPSPPEYNKQPQETYQNMADCHSGMLQHTHSPSPIKRPSPPAVKPKPPVVKPKPAQQVDSRVTRSAFGPRTAFGSVASTSPVVPPALPVVQKDRQTPPISTIWDPAMVGDCASFLLTCADLRSYLG
jgi:hypothetical protein